MKEKTLIANYSYGNSTKIQEGRGMKVETIIAHSNEIFVEGDGVSVTINTWSNQEGANIMVHTEKDLSIRMAGAFRWEELDMICAAIAVARTA